MFKTFAFRIFIVALVLRLIPVILARGLGIGLDDMFQYDMLARSLAGGHGFRWYAEADLNQLASFVDFDLTSVKDYDPALGIPTSFRAPLYPTFLAIVYFFSGTGVSRFFAARIAQAIFLGAPLAPLTYWVAQRLFPLPSSLTNERGKMKEKRGKQENKKRILSSQPQWVNQKHRIRRHDPGGHASHVFLQPASFSDQSRRKRK